MLQGASSAARTSSASGKIAFDSGRDENSEIYVMEADGTNPVNLTNNAATDFDPSWSSDGTKIAFASDRDGNLEIYVMEPDGSNPVNLSNNAGTERWPSWLPIVVRAVIEATSWGQLKVDFR